MIFCDFRSNGSLLIHIYLNNIRREICRQSLNQFIFMLNNRKVIVRCIVYYFTGGVKLFQSNLETETMSTYMLKKPCITKVPIIS